MVIVENEKIKENSTDVFVEKATDYSTAQTPTNWVPGMIALGLVFAGTMKLVVETVKFCRSRRSPARDSS